MYVLKHRNMCRMKNTAQGVCQETNTTRGKTECCICLKTPPKCCIFHTARAQGGALIDIENFEKAQFRLWHNELQVQPINR